MIRYWWWKLNTVQDYSITCISIAGLPEVNTFLRSWVYLDLYHIHPCLNLLYMCCRLRKAGDLNGEEVSVKQEPSTPAKVSRYWWMDLSEKKGESPQEKKPVWGISQLWLWNLATQWCRMGRSFTAFPGVALLTLAFLSSFLDNILNLELQCYILQIIFKKQQ